MSRYLADRIMAEPRVTVHTGAEIVAVGGDTSLDKVTIAQRADATSTVVPCAGLFCFHQATPATGWLDGVALDEDGFVLTGQDLPDDRLAAFDLLGRSPLPFETNVPTIFAAGDVRHGSMKRVAAAVGDGASAVRSVHQATGR